MRIGFKISRTSFLPVAALMLALLLASCQKQVSINLATSSPQLVVEGAIENGAPPYVLLTTTFGFFSSINLSTLQSSFVHGATIQVNNGSKTINLKEYTIDTAGGNNFYIYSIDTANLGNAFVGELGKFYTLTIATGGKTYTSMTKIPYPKGLDTLWFAQPVFTGPNTPANAEELFGNYSDPDTPGNCVRYFTKRNNDIFYPGGLYSDELVNGKRVANIDIFAGYNNSANAPVDSLIYFYPGDTITLKWCEIDKGVYNFWNTYQFALQDGGNPFASPINVTSNITNGALGVWAGYGSIYTTIVAK